MISCSINTQLYRKINVFLSLNLIHSVTIKLHINDGPVSYFSQQNGITGILCCSSLTVRHPKPRIGIQIRDVYNSDVHHKNPDILLVGKNKVHENIKVEKKQLWIKRVPQKACKST